MTKLSELKNTHRPAKRTKLLGRGPGSGLGKTCGRGQKGDGARSGYKRRYGYEGGQVPLYRKLPTRGFTRGAFIKRLDAINLDQIEKMYNDGETVNVASLKERGYFSGPTIGIKILANGAIAKKLKIEANAFSKGAEVKLKEAGIEYILVNDLKS